MRVLLDECLPRPLKADLAGHDVRTVPEMGWAGKDNGELLALASGRFDVFVTVDRNLTFQQNPADLPLPVVVLVAVSNRLLELRPLMARVRDRLTALRPGEVLRIGPT